MALFVNQNGSYKINMKNELIRLSTFSSFLTTSTVSLLRLASSGFRYIGPGDQLECVLCGQTFQDWTDEYTLLQRHSLSSPDCILISKENDALKSGSESLENQSVYQESSCSTESSKYSVTEENQVEEPASVCTYSGQPRFPEYAIFSVRLSTYRHWVLLQSPEVMSQAGFYFTGCEDLVRCFYCGGGLSNWETEDDPWVEHAHWFPECEFLVQSKGRKFVENIRELVQIQESQQMTEIRSQMTTDLEESRTTEDNLDSAAVQSVCELGYTYHTVQQALTMWFQQDMGRPTASDLLNVIMDMEDMQKLSDSSSSSGQLQSSQKSPECLQIKESEPNHEDLQSIREENRKLKDMTICKICMENDITIVFLPCGHLASCSECAPAMRLCPVCRGQVKGTVRTFLT